MNHYPDLPARYRTLTPNAGDVVTEDASRRISIPLSAFAFGGLLLLWWLSSSQLKADQKARAGRR